MAREHAAGRRRARLTVGGVGVGLALVAIVALVGLMTVGDARDIAVSRQLAAQATVSLQTDPAEGLRLAAQAYELKPRNNEHRGRPC